MRFAIMFSLTVFSRHSTNLVTEPERGLRSPTHTLCGRHSLPPEITLECADKLQVQQGLKREPVDHSEAICKYEQKFC